MNETLRRQAIALYDRFTHDGMERRLFLTRMVALAGGVAAAEVLIGAISASPAAAAVVPENDPRIRTSTSSLLGMSKFPRHAVYIAEPAKGPPRRPTVMVIHENRGLNAHIRDVTRRLALAGFMPSRPISSRPRAERRPMRMRRARRSASSTSPRPPPPPSR